MPDRRSDLDISGVGWPDNDSQTFERHYAETIGIYGYSNDARHYLSGRETGGLFWI